MAQGTFFTPEKAVDIQRIIGADIMMAFDECTPGDADYGYAKKSLDLTERWLDRCIERFHETECPYGHSQALSPSCRDVYIPIFAAVQQRMWQPKVRMVTLSAAWPWANQLKKNV